jgi:Leucine-rich repeat (LRR) protein
MMNSIDTEKTSSDIASRLIIGKTRVRDGDGFIGTVLYVGPVPSAKDPEEIYAGVAWDDASRGKHDGSVICRRTNKLIRLFSCEGGSFMRLTKLDLGTILDKELMQSKYVTEDAPLVAPNNLLPHSAQTASGKEKPIEFVGELQIRKKQQLDQLDRISLRNLGIARVVADGSLTDFSRLKEMDLAGNLLSDWREVMSVFEQLPLLEDLSLASNRLCNVPATLIPPCHLERVKILNLHRCSISAQTLPWIAKHMPGIEELCLAHNDMRCISSNHLNGGFGHLRFLDVSGCALDSWREQIACLGSLPNLEQLLLDDNPIETISIDHESIPNPFQKLITLHLVGTKLTSWTELDRLSSLPSLVALQSRRSPLTDSIGVAESRAITIARLPRLEYLNSSSVSEKERTEAERRYMSIVAKELLIAASTEDPKRKEAVLSSHPRFDELIEKHKDAMTSSVHISVNGNLAQHAINVTIRSLASASCTSPPLQKRLPGGLKVGRIKAMCFRAFGLDPDLQILHFRVNGDPFPTQLDDDDHTLSYYGVADGSEILMNELDPEALEKAEAHATQEHSRLVAEQERDARALQELQRSAVDKERLAAIEHATERMLE